jgi:glycosyltransferase involved in cell wall biosynthesis
MNKPKISIVTAVYNRKEDLKVTVDSIKKQIFTDFEWIVIDGASKDGTVDVIKENEEMIKDWISEPDTGIYNAMNKGAKKASGEYLFFLNAGDYFYNETVLQEVVDQLEGNDLVYGAVEVYGENAGSKVYDKVLTMNNLKLGTKVSQQAVFVKKSIFDEVGGLSEKYWIAGDYDLLCKVFEVTEKIKKIDTIIVRYQWGGLSSNLKKTYKDTLSVVFDNYGWFYAFIYWCYSRVKLYGRMFLSLFGVKF